MPIDAREFREFLERIAEAMEAGQPLEAWPRWVGSTAPVVVGVAVAVGACHHTFPDSRANEYGVAYPEDVLDEASGGSAPADADTTARGGASGAPVLAPEASAGPAEPALPPSGLIAKYAAPISPRPDGS